MRIFYHNRHVNVKYESWYECFIVVLTTPMLRTEPRDGEWSKGVPFSRPA